MLVDPYTSSGHDPTADQYGKKREDTNEGNRARDIPVRA